MKNYCVIVLFVPFLFLGLHGCVSDTNNGEVVWFTTEIASDATPAVLKRIMEAGEKPISEIKFEPDTYHFYPDKGLEFFVHISNHNDEVIRTAFPLTSYNFV